MKKSVSAALASVESNYLTPTAVDVLKQRVCVPSDEMIHNLQSYMDMCAEQYDLAADLMKVYKSKMPKNEQPHDVAVKQNKKIKNTTHKPSITIKSAPTDDKLTDYIPRTHNDEHKYGSGYKQSQRVYQRYELKNMAADYTFDGNVFETPCKEMNNGNFWAVSICKRGSKYNGPLMNTVLYIRDPRDVMSQHAEKINAGIKRKVQPIWHICAHIFNRYYKENILTSHITAAKYKK